MTKRDEQKARKPALASKRDRADPEQSQRFIDAARELGADQSEEAFNEALRKIARAPVPRKGEVPGERVPSNRKARKTHTTKHLKEPEES